MNIEAAMRLVGCLRTIYFGLQDNPGTTVNQILERSGADTEQQAIIIVLLGSMMGMGVITETEDLDAPLEVL